MSGYPGQPQIKRGRQYELDTCHVRDGDYGECTLPLNHGNGSKIHTELRDGKLWAEWRSVIQRQGACVTPGRSAAPCIRAPS